MRSLMTDDVNAEIIAIGTEILLGEITDTNSVYLAQQLRDIGVNVFFMTAVGDNSERIQSVVEHALNRNSIVITCGGLGPTVDDVTRDGVAQATKRPLVFDPEAFEQIKQRFESYNAEMPENNRRQAYLPEDGLPVANPVGTAPGFLVELDDKVVISLPGVPRELKYLMQNRIVSYLLERYKLGIIKSRTLRAAGIGESTLDELLGANILTHSNPTVGLAAHHGIIDIRITAKANSLNDVTAMLDEMENEVMAKASAVIFGRDGDLLEKALESAAKEAKLQVGITEIGITGALTDKLLQTQFDPNYLSYSFSCDNLEEITEVNIPIESTIRTQVESVVRAMQKRYDSTVHIAIISDPDINESADSEQRTAVAVLLGDTLKVRNYGFGAKSELARDWVSRWAMASAWHLLQNCIDN